MLHRHTSRLACAITMLTGLVAASVPAGAENIAVGNYGSSANGMPFTVALAKGYFKEEGADVTGIISSQGGGTSVRNAMAGVAYPVVPVERVQTMEPLRMFRATIFPALEVVYSRWPSVEALA